jgi:SNF2 family DNA or RNA helicase
MSNPLHEEDDEEAQLLMRLAEIRAAKELKIARDKEAEDERLAIAYESLSNGIDEARTMMAHHFYIKSLVDVDLVVMRVVKSPVSTKVWIRMNPYRADVVAAMMNLPSRKYDGRYNSVDLADYRKLQASVAIGEIPKCKLKYDADTLNAITDNRSSALYDISISNKFYIVSCISDLSDTSFCNGIPGKRWDMDSRGWYIPLSEGWRLFAAAQTINPTNEDGIVKWTDEALKQASDSAEARLKVIDIQQNKSTLDENMYAEVNAMFKEPWKARPFQKAGIAFAEAVNLRFLNCDEMGLGKTCQAIGIALRMREQKRVETGDPLYNPNVLIVCPANLVSNWLAEIKKFAGEEGIQLSGRQPDKHIAMLMLKRKYTFYVMSYDSLRWNEEHEEMGEEDMPDGTRAIVKRKTEVWPWLEIMEILQPELVLADEIHYIKNVDAAQSQAMRRLAACAKGFGGFSGTPIVNRVDELWPLLNCVQPDIYNSFTRFCNSYSKDGRFPRNVGELHELLKPIMIRRYKRDVILELPEVEHIVRYHTLSKKAKKLYDKVLQGLYTVLADWNPAEAGAEKKVPNVLVQIMRLKQVCAIDKINATAEFAVELYDSAPDNEPNKKVLIFTQFVPIANAIARRLGGEAVVMTGQVSEVDRRAAEKEFQENPNIHFLVASAVAREGLNLTMGRHVVFNDLFWTPKDFMQMIGRCYGRISNMHGASAYYMLANPTIENWIWDLLDTKLMIIGQVVDGHEVTGDESIVKDLLKKLKSELRLP